MASVAAVRRLLVPLALVLLAALAGHVVGTLRASGAGSGPARVVRVVDGDTLDVALGSRRTRVRVIGVDTPELRHGAAPEACFGRAAAAETSRVALGRRVELVRGVEPRDRYGRTLASVRLLAGPAAGVDLASLLAAGGFARRLPIEPNTANAALIAGLEAGARRARRGLWARCGFAGAFPGRRPG